MSNKPRTQSGDSNVIAAVAEQADELQRLCVRYHVRQLGLFGSAATATDFANASDLDFIVEFQPMPVSDYADAYFGLLESLLRLFGRPVDLVVDSAIENPYFRQAVEETRTPIYAA